MKLFSTYNSVLAKMLVNEESSFVCMMATLSSCQTSIMFQNQDSIIPFSFWAGNCQCEIIKVVSERHDPFLPRGGQTSLEVGEERQLYSEINIPSLYKQWITSLNTNWVWKTKYPQQVKLFLQLVRKEALFTWPKLQKKRIE